MKFKAQVDIMLKEDVPDHQAKSVLSGLKRAGIQDIEQVNIGKHITLVISAGSEEEAKEKIAMACERLLVNPTFETYHYELKKIQDQHL
ncbi:MAG: phosphoribosylformylglycinamidine synthase subunit PurS [Saprospiraceae bacterium]|nr:phosphoribosylformylglycinamidine synthase subunit PurS [Saprospiraceae bacterium]